MAGYDDDGGDDDEMAVLLSIFLQKVRGRWGRERGHSGVSHAFWGLKRPQILPIFQLIDQI